MSKRKKSKIQVLTIIMAVLMAIITLAGILIQPIMSMFQ
ncbi:MULTISPECIES: DUF4044 domain-containing protein [Amylolactobacillus]|nr:MULTISPECIES: DUF4044 domain-containing protein [Amylolactobacillus]